MKIYKVKPAVSKPWIFNLWAWGSISVLVALACVGLSRNLDRTVALTGTALAIGIVAFAVPFAYVLIYRNAMRQSKQGLSFEVDDEKITTKKGTNVLSTVRFDEITTAGEYKGWFIAGNQSRAVRIPIDVDGYRELRRTLESGHSLEPLKTPSSLFSYLYPATFLGLLIVFFVTAKASVALICGVVLLIFTLYSSYQLFRGLKRKKSLAVGFAMTILNVLIWIYLMYSRAHRL